MFWIHTNYCPLGAVPVAGGEGLHDVDLEQVVIVDAGAVEEDAQALEAQRAAEAVDVIDALHLAVAVAAADVARLELIDGAVRHVLDGEDPLATDDAPADRDGLNELPVPGLEERVLALEVVVARRAPLGAVDGVGDGGGVRARDGHDADVDVHLVRLAHDAANEQHRPGGVGGEGAGWLVVVVVLVLQVRELVGRHVDDEGRRGAARAPGGAVEPRRGGRARRRRGRRSGRWR